MPATWTHHSVALTMLHDTTIIQLKGSLSDVDHLLPVGQLTPPSSSGNSTSKTRSGRSFSWSKLTGSIRGRRQSSRSSETSQETQDNPQPTADTLNLESLPTPELAHASSFSSLSTTASNSPAAPSGLQFPSLKHIETIKGHSYSVSESTRNFSWPIRYPQEPSRSPLPPPLATSFGSTCSSQETSLERVPKTPPELHRSVEPLRISVLCKQQENMEPKRLQPPAMGGTKRLAVQQAKEMEALVAERAKRSGDESPPYDFYELIGKGAYGRVFKGLVGSMHLRT